MGVFQGVGGRPAGRPFSAGARPAPSHDVAGEKNGAWASGPPRSGSTFLQNMAARLDIPEDVLNSIALRARANGTALQTELLASGIVREEALYEAIAEELGLPVATCIDPTIIVRDRDLSAVLTRPGGVMVAKIDTGEAATDFLISPDLPALPELRDMVRRDPIMAERLLVTSRQRLREAFIGWGQA